MSRDIVDTLGLGDGLVVLGGVEGEVAEEVAVEREDAYVASCGEDDDSPASVGVADSDVVELSFVAEGDFA